MPTINVRWADNTKDLARNLKEGVNQIDATKSSVERLVKSLAGDNLVAAAHRWTAAISEMGGVAKIASADAERAFNTISKAIAALERQGKVVPTALRETRQELEALIKPASAVNQWFGEIGSSITKTAAGFVSAQAVIGTAQTAYRAFVGFVQDSIKSYASAEAAQSKLTTALKAQGQAAPETIKQYNDLATQFQKTTVYSDDLINNMEALLVQVGKVMPEDMEAALTASTNLATGLGIDLQQATTLVAKAFGQGGDELGKLKAILGDAAPVGETMAEVLEAINAQFGGQAAAQIETYSGKIEQLANNWDNVKEAVGKAFVEDPLIKQSLDTITKAADEASESQFGFSEALQNVYKTIPLAGPLFAQLAKHYEETAKAARDAAQPVKFVGPIQEPFKPQGPQVPNDFYLNQQKAREAAQKKAQEALNAYNEVLRNVIATEDTYAKTIDTIDGKTVEGIKYYLERGRSVHELAVVYGLLDSQVQAVKDQMDAEAVLAKRLTAIEIEAATNLKNFGDIGQQVAVKTRTLADELEFLQRRGEFVASTFIKMGGAFSASVKDIDVFGQFDTLASTQYQGLGLLINGPTGLTELQKQTGKETDKVAELSQAFSNLANIAGGTFGGIVQGIASGIAVIDTFQKSIKQIQAPGAGILDKLSGYGGIISSVIEGVKLAIEFGKGIAKLLGAGPSKQELEGRAVGAEFEKRFSSVAQMINEIGRAYASQGKTLDQARAAVERYWKAQKDGAAATTAALEEINEILKRQQEIDDAIAGQGFESQDQIRHAADIANAAYELMKKQREESGQFTQQQVDEAYRHYQELLAKLEGAAGDAARAWLMVHPAADDAAEASSDAMKSAEADLKALIDKRNALAKGIAAEAPEEVMGVIEAQQRGELATLDDEIQRKADEYAELARSTGKTMADEIKKALEDLHVTINVGYNLPTPEAPEYNKPPGERVGQGINVGEPLPDHYNTGGFDDRAWTGGLISPWGLQHFTMGGLVGPRGEDKIPIWTAEGEGVVSRVGMGVLGEDGLNDLNAGRTPGGANETYIKNYVVLDGQIVTETVWKKTAQDKRGLKIKGRRALGL